MIRATLGFVLACIGAVVYAFLDRNNNHGEDCGE
jgi:hypothetical protein